MYFMDEITLIDIEKVRDADGYVKEAEIGTEIFADKKSVTRTEFYEGLKAGLKLTAAFNVRACDYGGQQFIDYDGVRYEVQRTYNSEGVRLKTRRTYRTDSDNLELNCTEVTR